LGGTDVFHRSTPRTRFGLMSAAIIALLVLSAGSVAADTGPGVGTFTQNGKSADTYAGDCDSNGDGTSTCWDAGLSVFAGKMSDSLSGVTHSNQVCAFVDSYTYDETTGDYVGDPTYESGCKVDLPSGTLTFGRNLSSATLATTTIAIQQYVCDEYSCEPGASRDVTIGGTWTGVGPTFSQKYRSASDDGTCRFNESGKGSSREASFSGTIAGRSLEDVYGSISDGKFTYRSRCVEV
jgi:hypothetical protein